jgi:hypothetical protein
VEGDDGGDAAGLKGGGEDGEKAVEVGELAIDKDANGLEGAGGGVELGAGGPLEGEIAGLADDGGEVFGGGDGRVCAALDDEAGDRRGVLLKTQLHDCVGEVLLRYSGEQG